MENEVSNFQKLANIYKTMCCCAGHKKAERNERLYAKLIAEMKAAGEPVPAEKDLVGKGVFNGPGAS